MTGTERPAAVKQFQPKVLQPGLWRATEPFGSIKDIPCLPPHSMTPALRTAPPPTQGGSFDELRHALRIVRPHVLWFAGHGDARQTDGRRTLGFSSSRGDVELFDPVSVAYELRPYLPLSGGNLECVKAILETGASKKTKDKHKHTAYDWAMYIRKNLKSFKHGKCEAYLEEFKPQLVLRRRG